MSRIIDSQVSRNLSLQLNYVPYRQKDQFLSPKLSKISSRTSLSYKSPNPIKNIYTISPNQQKIVCPQPQKPIPIPIQQKNISQQQIIVQQSQGIDEIDILKIEQLISDNQVHEQNKIVQQPSQTTDHFDEYKIIQASNQDQEQQFTFHQNQIHLEELQQQEKIVQVPKIIITQVKKERFTSPVNRTNNMPHKFSLTRSTKIGSPKNFKPIFKLNSNPFIKPIPNIKNQKQQKFNQIMKNLKTTNKFPIPTKPVLKKQQPKGNKLLMRFKKKTEHSNQ